MSPLRERRLRFRPSLPRVFSQLESLTFSQGKQGRAVGDAAEIAERFPKTFGRPIVHLHGEKRHPKRDWRVGVLFSGGQAPGGHNVVISLFETLQTFSQGSRLYGFLDGPDGILQGRFRELVASDLDSFRNQGGFDLLGSSRTAIDSRERRDRALQRFREMELDGLVVIGGDDSHTGAALLAEYCLEKGSRTVIVGVPKTIDGDLRGDCLEISFGFDTACRTYSEMIGNIARDALSAKKYLHFIKLMGRSASHVALECALQTHPNFTLIGEEMHARGETLQTVIREIASSIEKRGREYGVVLIPEGLIASIPEIDLLIGELNALPLEGGDSRGVAGIAKQLTHTARATLDLLPEEIQRQLLFDRDLHGNVLLSRIPTEHLLSKGVENALKRRGYRGAFRPIHHFFGYEGRSAFPSNFDATYCAVLGIAAALLVRDGLTGYVATATHLAKGVEEWGISGVPIANLMHMEMRGGQKRPVVKKVGVDLQGAPFAEFAQNRDAWMLGDHYRYPGPIQFEEDARMVHRPPLSLLS